MKKFINEEPFLIAEISANHNGSLTHAKKLAFSDVRVKLAASMAVEKAAFSMSIRRPGSVSL